MKSIHLILLGFIVIAIVPAVSSETYQVGPDRLYKSLKPILPKLQPGDVVEIEPGTYREAMKITVDGTEDHPITIRGLGDRRPVFDAEHIGISGRGSEPRAIFQVEGDYIVLEGLEMKNARNGNNGAGIRLNSSTGAVIRDCKISYCDMGIQGGDTETAIIEHCDIGFNGTSEYNGFSHNFYMTGNNVIVSYSYIHDSLYGQNYKSRAHYNELWYNWIVDSTEGEVGPVDGKGETDRPNSNTVMVGNVVVSKPNRTGNHSKYVIMGAELGGSHNGTLYMFHNILTAGSSRIQFVQLDDPLSNAEIHFNVFWGSDSILTNHQGSKSVAGSHNVIPDTAQIPEGFSSNYQVNDPMLQNPNENDYRIKQDSPLYPLMNGKIEYTDGDGIFRQMMIDPEHLQSIRKFETFSTEIHDFKLHEKAQ